MLDISIFHEFATFGISVSLVQSFKEIVKMGIDEDGSNLTGVSAKCWWGESSKDRIYEAVASAHNNHVPEERPSSSALSNRIRSSLAKLEQDVFFKKFKIIEFCCFFITTTVSINTWIQYFGLQLLLLFYIR